MSLGGQWLSPAPMALERSGSPGAGGLGWGPCPSPLRLSALPGDQPWGRGVVSAPSPSPRPHPSPPGANVPAALGTAPLSKRAFWTRKGQRGRGGSSSVPGSWGALPTSYRWTSGEGTALWPRRGHAPPTLTPCEPDDPSSFPQGAVGAAPGRVSGDPWKGRAQCRFSRVGGGRSGVE